MANLFGKNTGMVSPTTQATGAPKQSAKTNLFIKEAEIANEKAQKENSFVGKAKNFFKAIPRSIDDVGADFIGNVIKSTARAGGAVQYTVNKAYNTLDEKVFGVKSNRPTELPKPTPGDNSPLAVAQRAIFGNEELQTLPDRIKRKTPETEKALVDFGLDPTVAKKTAGALTGFGVLAGTILDVTPGGAEDDAIKASLREIVQSKSAKEIEPLLKNTFKIDEILAPQIAKNLETIDNPQTIMKIIDEAKTTGAVSEKTIKNGEYETWLSKNPEAAQDVKAALDEANTIENPDAQAQFFQSVKKSIDEKYKPIFDENPKVTIAENIDAGDTATETSSVISRVMEAIKEAKPLRGGLEKAYTAERGRRAAEVSDILREAKGEQGYREALNKLKGQLVEKVPRFEAPRKTLTQSDLDETFNAIQSSGKLDLFDKVHAQNGLAKLFDGDIPQPSQLVLLEDVFGADFVKGVLEKRTMGEKFKDVFLDAVNIPRSLIASFDMSAPLRQGIIYSMSNPVRSFKSWGEMFKSAFSKQHFDDWFKNLETTPEWDLIKDSKLYIANPNKIAGGINAREEQFISNALKKLPIISQINGMSERAYAGFLNKMRVDSFKSYADDLIKAGKNYKDDPELFNAAAEVVNTFTGRGKLPGKLERIAPSVNALFFSPRLAAARFNALNPVWYAKQPPEIRKKALGDFARFTGVLMTTLSLAKLAGYKVETNPTSPDFAKIQDGNVRYDAAGGFSQWVRLFAQLLAGETKSSASGEISKLNTGDFGSRNRADVLEQFVRSKLSPVAGALANEFLYGEDITGEKVTLGSAAKDLTIPLYIQDIASAMEDKGPKGLLSVGLPSFFGVGTQTYTKKVSDEIDFTSMNPTKKKSGGSSPSGSGKNLFAK